MFGTRIRRCRFFMQLSRIFVGAIVGALVAGWLGVTIAHQVQPVPANAASAQSAPANAAPAQSASGESMPAQSTPTDTSLAGVVPAPNETPSIAEVNEHMQAPQSPCDMITWTQGMRRFTLNKGGILEVNFLPPDGTVKLVEQWIYPPQTAIQVLQKIVALPALKGDSAQEKARLSILDNNGKTLPERAVPAEGGSSLFDLVPASQGVEPNGLWMAGTLEYENLEGGLWRFNADAPVQGHDSWVLRSALIATPLRDILQKGGVKSGQRVRVSGQPAAPENNFSFFMAGPIYELTAVYPVSAEGK